jgi:general secretion pathway protein A
MYKSFFQLKKKPFEITSDPYFLWHGEKHKEALATLKYGVLGNKGFLLMTGEVGTGKTTLIRKLTESLPKNVKYAYIENPDFEPLDFFNYIADSFNIRTEFKSKGSFLIFFKKFLLKASDAGVRVLLIIDEAQLLSDNLLEQIRLLSNIDKSETKLLNIFFAGQSEFNKTLMKAENRAVRQRITLNYNIEPFDYQETKEYINYRLKTAGAVKKIFMDDAVKKIYSFSKGYPRKINIICDHCLLSAYVKGRTYVDKKTADECSKELKLPNEITIKEKKRFGGKTFASAAVFLFITISIYSIHFYHNGPVIKSGLNFLPEKFITLKNNAEPVKSYNIENKGPGKKNDINQRRFSDSYTYNFNMPELKNFLNQKPLNEENKTAEKTDFNYKKIILQFMNNKNELDFTQTEKINKAAELLNMYPDAAAVVTGYTDSAGYPEYNKKLSEFRANVIKSYLSGKGINPNRIKAKGLGENNPVANNSTAKGKKANRRVEIEIYQKASSPE